MGDTRAPKPGGGRKLSKPEYSAIERQRELNKEYMDDLMKFVKDLNKSNEASKVKTFKWDEN